MPSLHETEVGHPNINPVGNSSEGEKASGIVSVCGSAKGMPLLMAHGSD